MEFVTLRRAGGSLTLTIPRALVRALGLAEGARVGVSVNSGKLIAEPAKRERPTYSLDELLSECRPQRRTFRRRPSLAGRRAAGFRTALMRRGDIYFVDLDPTRGREQRGRRPVFIVTPERFNRLMAPLVAPITSGGAYARRQGFAVELTDRASRIRGAVLCNRLRTLDIQARNGQFVEHASDEVIQDVLARIATLIA